MLNEYALSPWPGNCSVLVRQWERIKQELRDSVYEDPQLFMELTPEELLEDLRDMGIHATEVVALKMRIKEQRRRNH
jgi:hypothetical protein